MLLVLGEQMHTLYGIGVGPGDPELITVKALRLLKEVPVIFAPYTREGEESIAGSIVKAVLSPAEMNGKELLGLYFPMTGEKAVLKQAWKEAALKVLERLQETDAAFVTLGDVSLYSTYPYLERTAKEIYPQLHSVIIPGVTSISACLAAGKQCVQGTETLAVVPVNEKTLLEPVIQSFD